MIDTSKREEVAIVAVANVDTPVEEIFVADRLVEVLLVVVPFVAATFAALIVVPFAFVNAKFVVVALVIVAFVPVSDAIIAVVKFPSDAKRFVLVAFVIVALVAVNPRTESIFAQSVARTFRFVIDEVEIVVVASEVVPVTYVNPWRVVVPCEVRVRVAIIS